MLLLACCITPAFGGVFTDASFATLARMNVVWAVPKQVWPIDAIGTYKVIPQEFSEAVISNATAIGAFKVKDKVRLSSEALAFDRKAMLLQEKTEIRWLETLPTLGYIKYYDANAEARAVSAVKDVPEPVVGVPDLAEATRLGLKYMRLKT